MVKLLEVFFALSAFGAVLCEPAGNDSATVRLPLSVSGTDYMVYTVAVHIGGQPFNLTLDTAATATLLFAEGLTYMRKNYACGSGMGQRNSFDPSKSASYDSSGKLIPDGWDETIARYPTVPYIGLSCEKMIDEVDDDLIGTQATDTFSFDAPLDDASVPLEVPRAGFNLANQSFYPVNARWASDGIFPLAIRELLGTGYGEYALEAVLDEVGGKREVTLFLNGTPSERSSPTSGGVITFGGRDTISCGDQWTQLPWGYVDAGTRVWNLDLTKLSVGSKALFTQGADALVAIGTPFLVVPMVYFRRTIIPFNPVYNVELSLYTVDCAKVATLPGIRFSIGKDYEYTVPAEKFAVKMTTKSGPVCGLLIMQDQLEWIIGSQFLPKQCIHLDYANTVISVAEPKTQ